jgi:pilus assembly protein Flp/PilA
LKLRRPPFKAGSWATRSTTYLVPIVLETVHKKALIFEIRRQKLKQRICTLKNIIARFLKDDTAATAIEYGLIARLIAVFIIAAVTNVSSNLLGT